MQTTELCQLIPTMPNCPRCLSKPVKPSRLQATSRFWLGAGGWRLCLVVMLGLGVMIEAGASLYDFASPAQRKEINNFVKEVNISSESIFQFFETDEHLGFFHGWEEPGLLLALQDQSEKTQGEAINRLTLRPVPRNEDIIKHVIKGVDNEKTRMLAIKALITSSGEYPPLVPRVAALLEYPDVQVRREVLDAIGDRLGVINDRRDARPPLCQATR